MAPAAVDGDEYLVKVFVCELVVEGAYGDEGNYGGDAEKYLYPGVVY